MKTTKKLLFIFLTVLIPAILITSCKDDDNNDDKDLKLEGKWLLADADVDATPREGASLTEMQLEDSLAAYTFFAPNSIVTFEKDSVSLTASLMGMELPIKVPYTYDKGVLKIATPMNLPFTIEGTVDINSVEMEFDLTPASYMSILAFIQPPFFDQLLSAHVDYTLLPQK